MGRGKRKGGPLGGLADAFVKAGVTSDKEARKARSERAREDRELGREGVAEREAERAAAEARRRDDEAERARAEARDAAAAAGTEQLRQALRAHAETARGPRRWHFVARDGRILQVEVGDATARLLADGQAGIVESLGEFADEHVVVVGRSTLTRLGEADAELVRFWNRHGGRP